MAKAKTTKPDPAGAPGGGDLVAHESEKRRDEHRRAAAAAPEQERRDEVDSRLAPSGALDDERAASPVDEGFDRLELPVVEVGVVAPDEGTQDVECLGAGGGRRGHAPTIAGAADIAVYA